MKKIILATNNPHKVEEFKRLLKDYRILTLKDIGFTENIVEDGYSFEENAIIKAKTVYNWVKAHTKLELAVLAEDSGLCVKAINYEPGIMSARYSGLGDEGNRKKLLNMLINIQDRTAYFQCLCALIMPEGDMIIEDGRCYGLITKSKIGDESFGYDCLFWSNALKKTFGQATAEEKDKVSHRAQAVGKIREYLESVKYGQNQFDDEE